MASLTNPISFVNLLFWLSCFLLIITTSSLKPLCRNDESSALLQFKQSFVVNNSVSSGPLAHTNVSSWNEKNTDCCLWDGVECDEETDHVIGLDLSSSFLYGSINSTSSLFHLVHLQTLNLADNHFNFSEIPATIKLLSRLTYLNLSNSSFSGQIPSEIAELSKLTSLDLGRNGRRLQLKIFDMKRLIQNLTSLETLNLRSVNIASIIPHAMSNLSHLTYLSLRGCNLWGPISESFSKLVSLTHLDLIDNSFSGQIPYSLTNQTHLIDLLLGVNQLTGPITSGLCNLSHLAALELTANRLYGSIPECFSNLVNLKYLNLDSNQLSGTIKLDLFSSLKHLRFLDIAENNFSLVTKMGRNATLPKFSHLGFADCNLLEFPDFLRQQHELTYLNLSQNKIHGPIPKWMGNIGRETLSYLFLSHNFITHIEDPSMFSFLKSLQFLDLSNNKLQGPLPIPPRSISSYVVSNNYLVGEISPLFCNIASLASLDLSYNNLTGKVPKCLGNFTDSLIVLNLANNFFRGSVPNMFANGGSLRMVDLRGNGFGGQLPRSLANCRELEILDVSENHISDKFPFWLATLQNLQVLGLRSNQYFGEMGSFPTANGFSKLRILDISCNNFTGTLPTGFIQNLSSMKDFDVSNFSYMQANQILHEQGMEDYVGSQFPYEIILANRGRYLNYRRIPNVIAAIDLSSNRFQGDIPPSFGTLKMLKMLNLSNNNLSGHIPSVLGSLTNLESLDLSINMLSGKIPLQLLNLTFLAHFNVSHNQLMGRIPEGKQFDTFDNTSYLENSGLCGGPLSKKCDDSMDSPPSHASFAENEDFGWQVVILGYGCGLIVGVIVGHIFSTKKREWLLKTFRIRLRGQNRRREQRRRH